MRTLMLGLVLAAGTAAAQDTHVSGYQGSFDDAAFELEQAITNKGLVIDYVSHVGEMLARTGEDVGSDVSLFEQADVYLFCSAVISREVMEAEPENIAQCPYGIYVAERDGEVTLGYRDYPDGAMQAVEDMLGEIVAEVTGG